jgi:hypothetical protein
MHRNAPTGHLNTADEYPYSIILNGGFLLTVVTITNALANPNCNEYKLILCDIDAIANQIKRISDAKIPDPYTKPKVAG